MAVKDQLLASNRGDVGSDSIEEVKLKLEMAALQESIAHRHRELRQESLDAQQEKSSLRYDGKTFDEWQTAWKTELSTEKRLEAVKARAAFGANGYGKQAAEAILDIAGQYDWSSGVGNDSPVDALRTACLRAFGCSWSGAVAQRLPTDDAVPVLLAAADSKNVNNRQFALWVLPEYMHKYQQAADAIAKLTDDPDPMVRLAPTKRAHRACHSKLNPRGLGYRPKSSRIS